jgi:pentatricopeptide repeat protein
MTAWETTIYWGSEIVDVVGHEILIFLAVVLIHTLLFRTHLTGGTKAKGKLASKANKAEFGPRLQAFGELVKQQKWVEAMTEFRALKPAWKFKPDAQMLKPLKEFVHYAVNSDMLNEFCTECQQMPLCEDLTGHIVASLVSARQVEKAKALTCSTRGSSGSILSLLLATADAHKTGAIDIAVAADAAEAAFRFASQKKMLNSEICSAVVLVISQALDQRGKPIVEEILQAIKQGLRPSGSLMRDIFLFFRPKRARSDSETTSPDERRRMLLESSKRVLEAYSLAGHLACISDPEAQKLVVDAALRVQDDELVTKLIRDQEEQWRQGLLKSLGNQNRMLDVWTVFNACAGPSGSLYNALLDACVSCHDYQAAEDVAAKATAAGKADIVTFNTLAKSRIKARQSSPNSPAVSSVLDLMSNQGLKPNHVTCSILLKSLQKGVASHEIEKVMHAVGSVEQDSSSETDDVLLSSVVEGCLRVDRVDLLLPWLRKWQNSRHMPIKRAYTYGSIIRAYGLSRDIRGVWEAWNQMKSQKVAPTPLVMGCLVEALVSNSDPEGAYSAVQQECRSAGGDKPVNAVIYGTLLKGFAHQKNFPKVWDVYQEMQRSSIDFSIVTYNTMIDACARCGEAPKMQAILADMQTNKVEPNIITLSAVLKGYCQDRQLEKAFELLETIRASSTFKADEIIYNSLLDGCAREGLWKRALGLLDQMQKDGIKPSNFTLSVLTKCARRSGCCLVETLELCNALANQYKFRLNVHVYANLIHLCADRKNVSDAVSLMKQMLLAKIKPDARSYQLLIRAMLDARDFDGADATLRAALRLPGASCQLLEAVAGDNSRLRPDPAIPRPAVTELVDSIAKGLTETTAMSLRQAVRNGWNSNEPRSTTGTVRSTHRKPRV